MDEGGKGIVSFLNTYINLWMLCFYVSSLRLLINTYHGIILFTCQVEASDHFSAAWTRDQVKSWAINEAKVDDDEAEKLFRQRVDGAVLVTIKKEDLMLKCDLFFGSASKIWDHLQRSLTGM